jgi:DNA-binding MarR family transcriptional regulator
MAGKEKSRQEIIASMIQNGREHSRLFVLFSELIAKRLGLSAADGECIDFLMDAGSATAGDLAKLTGLTTGAITGVIERLKRAGLVTAKSDPRDKRKTVIKPIMGKLRKSIQFYISHEKTANKQVYSRYSLKELETIADYHRRVTNILANEINKLNSGKK